MMRRPGDGYRYFAEGGDSILTPTASHNTCFVSLALAVAYSDQLSLK